MKLTQVLLAGAVAFVASNAMAYDIAHPFWGPAQGQVASETDYQYTRYDGNADWNYYGQSVSEKLSYGITDNWTVALTGAKGWEKEGYDHYKDNLWALSTTYNVVNDGKAFAQVGLGYGQDRWDDYGWTGADYNGVLKEYELTFKGGYNLGTVTPYTEAWIRDTLNQGKDNDARYGLRVAMNAALAQRTRGDFGVSYERRTAADHNFTLDAALSYMFTQNIVGKVYGRFLLHQYEAGLDRTQRANTIGANVKVAF